MGRRTTFGDRLAVWALLALLCGFIWAVSTCFGISNGSPPSTESNPGTTAASSAYVPPEPTPGLTPYESTRDAGPAGPSHHHHHTPVVHSAPQWDPPSSGGGYHYRRRGGGGGYGGPVHVRGYYRRNGTYVRPHSRRR